MTPGELQGTIDQMIGQFEQERARRLLAVGHTRANDPFIVHFHHTDSRYVSDGEMTTVMEALRDRFPDWKFHPTRKPPLIQP